MKEQQPSGSNQQNASPADAASKGHGQQGIDKAPGEETNQDNVQFQSETQKGKKVDADLSQESDKPAGQDLGNEFE